MASDNDMVGQLEFLTKDFEMNKSHEYYHQVQAEIYATNSPWCDFFLWAPSHFINIRVYPDRQWQTKTLPAIQNYFINNILLPLNNPRQFVVQIELLLKKDVVEPIPLLQMTNTRAQIYEFCQKTIGQCNNPKWLIAQPGRLSANLFYCAYITAINLQKSLNNPKTQKYVMQWAKAIFNYNTVEKQCFSYGNKHESDAVLQYQIQTGAIVSPSGMWLFPDSALYSAPDGLIYSNSQSTNLNGIVEIKCPERLQTENASALPFLNNGAKLDSNTQYYFQVQGHLAATNAPWCDFILWGPNYFSIERILPDQEWMTVKLPIIKDFVNNQMLPLSYTPHFWENIMTR